MLASDAKRAVIINILVNILDSRARDQKSRGDEGTRSSLKR
jgi:hypothetical protein